MASGKVKFIYELKKFGFISIDDGREVFVYSGIPGEDYQILNDGEKYEFEITESAKNIQSVELQRVN